MIFDPSYHQLSLLHDLLLRCNVATDGEGGNDNHQRPQAELEEAFAFRWVGFGRLGFHRRIIPDRGQPEQGILAAVVGACITVE